MSVQSISPHRQISARMQKILSISMAFEGRLVGVDLINCSDIELDILLGYAEEHAKRVADIRNGKFVNNKNYSKEDIQKMNKYEFMDFQKEMFMKQQQKT